MVPPPLPQLGSFVAPAERKVGMAAELGKPYNDLVGRGGDIYEVVAKGLKPGNVLPAAGSVDATLAERGSRYGDFSDHARLCQALILEMQEFKPEGTPAGGLTKWEQLDPVKRQALTVIADKVARILSGDPDYADNWHDIQGYAKLVEDRLPKQGEGA